MRCMTAIWPAGPPKLRPATRSQTQKASCSGTPCCGFPFSAIANSAKLCLVAGRIPKSAHYERACLSAPLPEVLVEVIEDFGTARDPLRIILGRCADTLHKGSDTCDFGSAELAVLEIDIVDDLADGAKRRVLEAAAIEQDLERALVALMREFRLEHVETQLAFFRPIAFAGDELELGFRIDKAAYQPSAGDAVDIDAFARHPGPVAKRFRRLRCGLRRVFASHVG